MDSGVIGYWNVLVTRAVQSLENEAKGLVEWKPPSWTKVKGTRPREWAEARVQLTYFLEDLAKYQAGFLRVTRESISALDAFLEEALSVFDAAVSKETLDNASERFLQDVTAALVGFAVATGRPRCMVETLRRLFRLHGRFPQLKLPSVLPFLKQLEAFQSNLDLSIPWSLALQDKFAEVKNSGNAIKSQPKAVPRPSIACNGKYIYFHSGRGLQQMGTGLHGTVKGKEYNSSQAYRINERVDICCVATIGKLFVYSSAMPWPHVEVIDAETLVPEGYLQLGLEPEMSPPDRPKAGTSVLMSDGRYLYLIVTEQYVIEHQNPWAGSQEEAEAAAREKKGEAAEPQSASAAPSPAPASNLIGTLHGFFKSKSSSDSVARKLESVSEC